MSLIELLKDNLIITTTLMKVDVNTSLTQFLIDRNVATQYETTGYSSNTSTVISIEFSNPTILSNIILQNHNFKQFRVFYDSVTANVFSPDINETTNSATSSYFFFNSTTVSSVQLQIDAATAADTEKIIGQLIATERRLKFTRNPSIKKFKPNLKKTQVEHKMPDGGSVLYNISEKMDAKIGLTFISTSFHNSLKDIFKEDNPLYYLPFPTTTAWDGDAFPVVWIGGFDFKFSSNAKNQGFTGNIRLKERPSA